MPELIKIKSPVRFVSMEPLLGPVVLGKHIKDLQWVIVGGESSTDGKSARPMNFEWAANIRDESTAAKVPFFFKQWGGKSNPEKKAKGKKLDGRRWTEYPSGYTFALPDKLTQHEQDRLATWEKQVTEGVKASITAAKALHRIYEYKQGKLWKAQGFEKFQDYCLVTWRYAKAHSYRLAQAGGFVLELESQSPNGDQMPLPQNEAQIRPVLELPEARRVEFWKEKIIDLGPDQITTKTVSNAVEEFRAENKIPPKEKKVMVAKVKSPAELKTRAVLALARFEAAVEGLPNSGKIQAVLKQVDKLLKHMS